MMDTTGTSETREGDSGIFSELLDKLYEQHLQELQAVREENAQLWMKVKGLEAACRSAQDAGLPNVPGSRDGAEAAAAAEVTFFHPREPSKASAEQARRAWQVAQERGGNGLGKGSEDSGMQAPQRSRSRSRSLVSKMSGDISSFLHKKEEVRLLTEKAQPRARSSALAFVEDLIQRPSFETFWGALILLNALVMAAEAQYTGLLLGVTLEHASVEGIKSATLWPGATVVFEAFGWFFGFAFLVELVLKVIGMRCRFPCFVWNWIDTFVVVLWVLSAFGASMPVDPNLIRIARLARLLRLLRLAYAIQGFDSLYLISTSLSSSVSILAWTTVMFLLCQMALALLLSALLAEFYFTDAKEPLDSMQTVYTYFGTFYRALFSMFEITLGNWPPISRMLAENVSPLFMLFGVMHKLSLGFAFVGVVNGVFMQETFKVASTDDKVMVSKKMRMANTHAKKMRWFFNKADRDRNELIDLDEFKEMASNPTVSMWLASMELDEKDHDLLFSLIDDGNGLITLSELIRGVSKLKGAARSIDVVRVMRQVEDIRAMLKTAGAAVAERPLLS